MCLFAVAYAVYLLVSTPKICTNKKMCLSIVVHIGVYLRPFLASLNVCMLLALIYACIFSSNYY